MTAATGLKRLAIAVAAVVAAAFVTLVALSFLIPAASVRDAVAKEIHAVTGLDPVLRGDISVSLFPSGTVSFRNVLLGDDRTGEPAVVADELTAHLRYFPLLAGRIEIADVTLVRPTITVTFLPGGQSNWSGLMQSLARALEPDPERTASFSEIGIHDGTVVIHGQRAGKDVTDRLDGVDFQLAWPSISRSFGANGRFVWHDEPVEASLTLGDFLAALNGERSGVKLRLSGAPVKVAFDGATSDQPTLKVEGTLSVEAPSLRDALRWTDTSELPFGGFGRFALRAQSQHRRRRGLALRRQRRTRRQCRRRRDHALDRPSHGPGHARGRRARSDAVCLRNPPAGRERTRPGINCRLRLTDSPTSTSICGSRPPASR